MKNLVNNIISLLEAEQIKVLYFKEMNNEELLSSNFLELAIEITDKDVTKWNYFVSKVNQEEKVVNTVYNDSIYKFVFINANNSPELVDLKQDLKKFYDKLQKKYFKVCPVRKNFTVDVKVTHRCNLDCKYCYDKPYREKIKKDMSFETVERLFKLLSEYTESAEIYWQGGEPTLVGTDWYRKVHEEIVPKYPMLNVEFKMMSNGVLFNNEWFDLIERYGIGVGVGYNALFQAQLRCMDQDNKNMKKEIRTSKIVEKNIKRSIERGKPLGCIDVITVVNYKHLIDIYKYYKQIGVMSPCMNYVRQTKNTEKNKLGVSAEEYAKEYLKYFKYWLYDKNGIQERSAEEMLSLVIGSNEGITCHNLDCRYRFAGINPLGEIYPCDNYYPEEYKLGNLFDISNFESVFKSESYQKYYNEVQERFDKKCSECGYWFACKGGCNAGALSATGTITQQEDFYCKQFKLKYKGVYDILRDLEWIDNEELNPYARKILIEKNFYSVKEIKEFINGKRKEFKLEYDPEKLLNCSEYQVFRGVNKMYDDCGIMLNTELIDSFEKKAIKMNKEIKRMALEEYLKVIARDTIKNTMDN